MAAAGFWGRGDFGDGGCSVDAAASMSLRAWPVEGRGRLCTKQIDERGAGGREFGALKVIVGISADES